MAKPLYGGFGLSRRGGEKGRKRRKENISKEPFVSREERQRALTVLCDIGANSEVKNLHLHLFRKDREGRLGTTDDFTSEEPLVLEREIERGREGMREK